MHDDTALRVRADAARERLTFDGKRLTAHRLIGARDVPILVNQIEVQFIESDGHIGFDLREKRRGRDQNGGGERAHFEQTASGERVEMRKHRFGFWSVEQGKSGGWVGRGLRRQIFRRQKLPQRPLRFH